MTDRTESDLDYTVRATESSRVGAERKKKSKRKVKRGDAASSV